MVFIFFLDELFERSFRHHRGLWRGCTPGDSKFERSAGGNSTVLEFNELIRGIKPKDRGAMQKHVMSWNVLKKTRAFKILSILRPLLRMAV